MKNELDTPTILAALDVALIHLSNICNDPRCRIHQVEHGAIVSLRILRSRIEKERPFLEAAMALARYKLGYGGDGSLRTSLASEFVRTYVALTEKPPAIDEGEASRGGCQ